MVKNFAARKGEKGLPSPTKKKEWLNQKQTSEDGVPFTRRWSIGSREGAGGTKWMEHGRLQSWKGGE